MPKIEDGCYGSLKGIALIAKVLAGRCRMHYTRVAAGKGAMPEDLTPKTLTEPPEYVMDAMISSVTNPVDGECQVSVQINSAHVENGFYCTWLILYAEDPDEGEVPFTALCLENEPEWIRPASSIVGKLAHFDIIAAVGDVDNVSATIDPDALVTLESVQQLIIEHGRDAEAHQDIRQAVKALQDKLSAAPSGTGAPTEDTPSVVGGRYFDTEAKQEYICVEVTPEGKTVWQPSGGGAAKPSTGAPSKDETASVGDKVLDTEGQREYICVGTTDDGKPIWKQMIYADDLAKHDSDPNAHANRRHVVAVRTRDSAKPDYGLGGGGESGLVAVALDAGEYTGTAEVSAVVSGVEYDARNMSANGENVPDGTLILRKMEEK